MAWIKNDDTYDKWSLRIAFSAAATALAGLAGVAIGALAAPAIVPAAGVVTIVGGLVETATIMHGMYRAANP